MKSPIVWITAIAAVACTVSMTGCRSSDAGASKNPPAQAADAGKTQQTKKTGNAESQKPAGLNPKLSQSTIEGRAGSKDGS